MKSVLPVGRVADRVAFCAATSRNLNPDEERLDGGGGGVRGAIFHDGRSAWMARGNALEIVSTADGARLCAYRFAEEKGPVEVTCVAELPLATGRRRRLIVGLSCPCSRTGLVCVLDERACKVTVAVSLPAPVTALDRVDVCGASPLRHMQGAVAAGTRGGRVFVVDLALDAARYSDETRPHEALCVPPHRARDAAELRADALRRERCLAVAVDDDCATDGGRFRCDDRVSFPCGDVYVSAVRFLPRPGYLAVGYNVGVFRLWNATTCSFESCSAYDGSPPAVGFAFQEPENDPKPFCYLWAAHRDGGRPDSASKARLYSLTFRRGKADDDDDGAGCGAPRYEGPVACALRFEYALGAGRGPVACSALEGPSACDDGSSNLCAFAWARPGPGDGAVLAVFDLNQWYLAQMPSRYRYDEADLCPYLGFFRLDEVLEGTAPRVPLDVHVPARKVCGFPADASMERQFYPSALSFDALCLTPSGVVSASYLGLQRHVLEGLASSGPWPLLDPREAHAACRFAGLVPPERRGPAEAAAQQREAIFSLAIEHDLAHLVTDCVSAWATGEYAHLECSPRTIQEWAWKKAGQMKSSLDRFCCGLFDLYGVPPDEAAVRQARRIAAQLGRLAAVFRALLSPAVPTTEHGTRECESKLNAINLLATYARVALWFLNCRLLPETAEGDPSSDPDAVAFPAAALARVYRDRRRELKRVDGSAAIGGTGLLMIDGLVARLGGCDSSAPGPWEKEGGDGLFPPPSLHALLGVYLLDGVPLAEKHRVVHYLFLDLAELFPTERHEELVAHLVRFPSTFALSPSVIKLTQGFWLLDRKDFEEAIAVLLDPLVNAGDVAHWQHMRVLKALLYQNECRKALKYARLRMPAFETPEDVRLMLTILLANGQVAEAFFYQRENRDDANFEDMMFHFFAGCQQTKNLDALLQFPLSVTEEDALVRFLRNDGWPRSREVLVMYFLQRGRYAEAFGLNEELNAACRGESDPATGERASVRNIVAGGYAALLPRVQRALSLPRPNRRPVVKRSGIAPLSARVVAGPRGQPVTQSSVIAEVADLVEEMWKRVPAETTPLRRRRPADAEGPCAPFARPPSTPASRLSNDRSSVIRFPSAAGRPEWGPRTEAGDSAASPTKKSRYADPIAAASKPVPLSARVAAGPLRIPAKYYVAEARTLLQTPPVRRKTASLAPVSADVTPQSILKVRRVLRPVVAADLAEEDGESTDACARQLRFQASHLSESSGDTQLELEERETSVHAAPRRPLRFDRPPDERPAAETTDETPSEVASEPEDGASSPTLAPDAVDPPEEPEGEQSDESGSGSAKDSSLVLETVEEEPVEEDDVEEEVKVDVEEEEDEEEEEEKLPPRVTRSSSSMSASPTGSAASVSPVTRSRSKLLVQPGRTKMAPRTGGSAGKKKATTASELEEGEEKDLDTPLPTLNRSRLKSVPTPSTRRSPRRFAPSPQQEVALFSFSNPTVLLTEVEAGDLPPSAAAAAPGKSFVFSPPMTRSRARRSRRESDNESACSDTDGSVTSTYSLRSNRRLSQQQGGDTPINFLTCHSLASTSSSTTTTSPAAARGRRAAARRFVKFR